jgi:NAD-dependent dihydropyrimidine dehydrogenase PreA subunit
MFSVLSITIFKSCYNVMERNNGRAQMSEETWHGIPRNKIQWYPTINYEKCVTCGKCVDFCHMSVFATKDSEGKKRTFVKNPYSCVVTCRGCDSICPTGAIKHPSEREFREKIKDLRRNPMFKIRKN